MFIHCVLRIIMYVLPLLRIFTSKLSPGYQTPHLMPISGQASTQYDQSLFSRWSDKTVNSFIRDTE